MQKLFRVTVDISKKIPAPAFEVNTNDLKSVKLEITITNGQSLLDLTDVTPRINIRKPDNEVIFQDCEIVDAKAGKVQIVLENQAYLVPGTHTAEIACYKGNEITAITGTFSYKSVKGIMNDEAVESKSEFTAIDRKIEAARKLLEDIGENGVGVDEQARQEIQEVSEALAGTVKEVNGIKPTNGKISLPIPEVDTTNLRTKTEKLKLEDMSPEALAAIEGGEGTSFNLLSIPQDRSVTPEKTDFIISVMGKNLYDYRKSHDGKYLHSTSGQAMDNAAWITSDFLQVVGNTDYSLSPIHRVSFYTSEKTYISFKDMDGTSFKTPANCAYIRFDLEKTRFDYTKVMLNKGTSLLPFESYTLTRKFDSERITIIEEGEITPDKTAFFSKELVGVSKNQFNKSTVADGMYLYSADGQTRANTNYATSYYIPVTGDTVYSITRVNRVCFYDSEKILINFVDNVSGFTTPSNAKYLRFDFQKSAVNLDTLMLNVGANLLPYEAYVEDTVFKIRKDYLPEIEAANREGLTLSLPKKYELVVGDTFELFFKGILMSKNPENYDFKLTCTKGSQYAKRFIYTPVSGDVGSHNLRIDVYDDFRTLVASKTTKLVVKNKATSPSASKNVLCVGDSLTTGGTWVRELHRRLTGSGGTPVGDGLTNINFIGKVGTSPVKYEGYGGWSFLTYNVNKASQQGYWITVTSGMKASSEQHSVYKDANGVNWKLETINTDGKIKIIRVDNGEQLPPSSGTLTWVSGGIDKTPIVYSSYTIDSNNPFWNDSTGKVDFKAYASSINATSIDYCYILLGWNSSTLTENEYKEQARIFIRNLLRDYPNCKITLIGIQVPSIDGFGYNYGASWNYMDKLKYVFNLNDWYEDLAAELSLDTIQLSGQFDTENNMPQATRTVNTRSTKTETYGNNGVHPAESGYMQIADAVYRNITHKI